MTARRPVRRQVGRQIRAGTLVLATVLVTGVLTGIGLLSPGLAPGPGSSASAATGGIGLQLTRVGPAALKPGDDVLITGRVSNGTAKRLTGARVSVNVHPLRLADRASVQRWTSGETDGTADRRLPTEAKVRKLAAGADGTFSLRLPVLEFGLGSLSSTGPRGITVQVTAGQRTLASRRTTIIWWPQETATSTRLTLLAPITPSSPSTDAGAPTAEAEADLASGGRLDRLLDATQDSAFGWAVDPSVLAAASSLKAGKPLAAASPASSGSSSPAGTLSGSLAQDAATKAGREWLTKFTQRVAGRSVIGLPYADPDINSVLNNEAATLLRMTRDLGRRVTQETVGQQFDSTIAWPGDGRLPTRSVASLAKGGYSSVLLASSTQPVENAPEGTTYSGRSTLAGGGRSLDGLLYDEELSTLVSGSGGSGSVEATQSLLAELSTITLAQPSQPLHLLAVTPRTWSPDPLKVSQLSSTLRMVPFVQVATLPELATQDPVGPRAAPVYRAAAKASELPPSALQRALALKRRIDVIGPALSDPDAVLDPERMRVASLLSVAWRRDPDALASAGTEIDRRVRLLVDGVHLEVGTQSKLFTARASSIPLVVSNDTDLDLSVRIVLKPNSGQLAMDSMDIVARANQQTNVLIPTRAIASGDVVVNASLQNPDGKLIEEPAEFRVRVRPDWETRGMIGAGSVLALLMVVGLLRGIRRNRTRVRPADVPDVDDLAVEKEQILRTGGIPVLVEPAQQTTTQTTATQDTTAQIEVGVKSGDT